MFLAARADTDAGRASGPASGASSRARALDSFLPSRLRLPRSRPVFLFQVPGAEENLLDDKHLLKPWDAKKVGVARVPLLSVGQVPFGPC